MKSISNNIRQNGYSKLAKLSNNMQTHTKSSAFSSSFLGFFDSIKGQTDSGKHEKAPNLIGQIQPSEKPNKNLPSEGNVLNLDIPLGEIQGKDSPKNIVKNPVVVNQISKEVAPEPNLIKDLINQIQVISDKNIPTAVPSLHKISQLQVQSASVEPTNDEAEIPKELKNSGTKLEFKHYTKLDVRAESKLPLTDKIVKEPNAPESKEVVVPSKEGVVPSKELNNLEKKSVLASNVQKDNNLNEKVVLTSENGKSELISKNEFPNQILPDEIPALNKNIKDNTYISFELVKETTKLKTETTGTFRPIRLLNDLLKDQVVSIKLLTDAESHQVNQQTNNVQSKDTIGNSVDYQQFNKIIASNLNYNIFNKPAIKKQYQDAIIKQSPVNVSKVISDNQNTNEQKPVPATVDRKNLKQDITVQTNSQLSVKPTNINQKDIKPIIYKTETFSLADYLHQQNMFQASDSKVGTSKYSQQVKFDIPVKFDVESIAKLSNTPSKQEPDNNAPKQTDTTQPKVDVKAPQIDNVVYNNNTADKKVAVKIAPAIVQSNILNTKELQSLSPGGVPSYVLKQISETSGNSFSTAQLTLKPESLGMLLVEITVKDNIANVSFSTKTQEAMKAIESQIPILKDKLAQHGLQSDKIEVKVKDTESYGSSQKNTGESTNENYQDSKTRKDFVKSFAYLKNNDFISKNIRSDFSSYNQLIYNKFSVV